jgi:hypothetical protein
MLIGQTGPGLQSQIVMLMNTAGEIYTNYPAADTIFKNSGLQFLAHLTGYDQVRLSVLRGATTGSTGSRLSLRGYTATSLVVGNFVALGESSTDVVVNIEGVNQITDSGWVTIDKSLLPAGGDLYLALVAHGGDGVADPKFIHVTIEFRSEAAAKAHVSADITTTAQHAQVWLNRDRHTVTTPTSATLVVYTTGGTYQGSYTSDTPDDMGVFTFDLALALSAATTYRIDAVVSDAVGDVSTSIEADTP